MSVANRDSVTPGLAATLVDEPAATGAPPVQALRARARVITLSALLGAAAAVALSFVLPPKYVAQVTVLEAPRNGGNSTLDQLGLGAQALGLSLNAAGSNALTYPDILRSRRLLERVLADTVTTRDGRRARYLDLVQRGPDGPERTERALKRVRERVDAALDRRTNMLTVRVADRDPHVAAAAANAACAVLQDIVLNGMTTQSGATRRFVERQLDRARGDLAACEGALRVFRESNLRIGNSPRLLVEQSRLLRVLSEREAVVNALARQYAMARVEEGRDVPVLNVLDPAVPPPFRSGPRRAPMAAGGALLGAALAAVLARPRPSRIEARPAAGSELERAA